MKTRLSRLLTGLLVASLLLVIGITALAAVEGEYTRDITVRDITVTVGDTTINNVYSDPADYWEVASGGSLTDYEIRYDTVGESDAVIYTGWYPNTTTGRVGNYTEYVCELDNGEYVVKKINTSGDGTTYIPVGGFVLSLNNSKAADFAAIGDKVTLGGSQLSIPTKAIESDSKRVVVDATNANRARPMVVYYDYQYGEKTGTNVFGSEVICQYDFEKNTFVVKGFRGFLQGDDSGSEIPDNGFVISAYGPGFRQLLERNQLFSLDDEVKMVGFDFIRFGGTVWGEFDYINPTKETNPSAMETATEEFPAFRGTDQTIIYKHGWSYKDAQGTGTNVYGYEAAVDANGVVVELGVNVSAIPEGGYVISGHGLGRDFIRANIVLGATVVLDESNKIYSVSTTLNSYYENLVTSVNSVIDSANTRIRQLYDVDVETLEKYIAEVTSELEELKEVKEGIEQALDNENLTPEARLSLLMQYNDSQLVIEKLRQQIIVSSAESKAVSARAVWHRPVEKNYAEIEENVKMYKEIGINLVFVETLYNGYSAFKSDVAEFPYHKDFADKLYIKDSDTTYDDYLTAFVACCIENGIEVHAWVENFYVGTQKDATVLKLHPDWIMYNDDNTYIQRNEGGEYIFIDPANKEVQDTLIAYYNDLFAKHPEISGLNLDYIRYPVSSDTEDTGYTMAAMKGFYELMGKEFSTAQLADRVKMANKFKQLFDKSYLLGGQKEADENFAKWVDYRMSVITEYVRRIKNEVKEENGIMLSTSVFASLQESTDAKKQDWKTWFSNGWIDIATPMAYYTDSSDVQLRVKEMILMAGNNCMYYTGIASSYSGLPAWQNKEHIEASYLGGASGYVVFCSTQIIGHDDVQNALKSGVNGKPAILPHADVNDLLATSFADIIDKSERLYIPAGGMTEQQKADLKAALDEIAAMSDADAESIYAICKRLESFAKTDVKSYAKGYSRQRIIEQINELVEILDARVSMKLIADGEWDPEVNAVRPSLGADTEAPDNQGNNQQKPGNSDNNNTNKNDDDEKGPNMLVPVLVICVLVLIASGAAYVILMKKKSNSAAPAYVEEYEDEELSDSESADEEIAEESVDESAAEESSEENESTEDNN